MPAKVRTIKATSIFAFETLEFNRSINYQGESLELIKLIEKKPRIITAKVYQDLHKHFKTKKDLIFKGIIMTAIFPDDLTNFSGRSNQKNRCIVEIGKCRKTMTGQYSH